MAIAFDATSNGGTGAPGTSLTLAHTISGTNTVLFVGVQWQSPNPAPTVTYAGASMMVTADSPSTDGSSIFAYLFYLFNPATGTNNIVVSGNFSGAGQSCMLANASYNGASQAGLFSQSHTSNTTATASTVLTTTSPNNGWLVGFFRNEVGGATAGTGTIFRFSGGDHDFGDSNGALSPAGTYSIIANFGSSGVNQGLVAAISPFGAVSAATPLLTLLGVGT